MLLSSLFLLFVHSAWGATTDSLFEEGTHCVGYKVEKVMLLVSSSYVIGKNCDVSAQVLPELGGLYRIEVGVPIRAFQSGEEARDQDVMKTLKADVRPEILFKSRSMTANQWRELFARSEFSLDGELSIGDKSYPLKVSSHYTETSDNAEVDGLAKVRFADFEISPPKVAGGLIAKSKPDFELHFHLLASRILGADTIRPVKIENKASPK